MQRCLRLTICSLLLCCASSAAFAQEEAAPPKELSLAWIEQRIAELQGSTLDEATKSAALGQYQQSLEQLRVADDWAKKAVEFERLGAEAPGLLTGIREELAKPPEDPAPQAPPDATLAQLEQLRVQAEGQLTAVREQAEQLRAESTRRTERRTALSDLLARQRQQLSAVDEGLRAASTPDEPLELRTARRTLLVARRLALANEVRSHELELSSYDARAELLPARRDRAQRRVSALERLGTAWQRLVDARRRREADEAVRQADRLQREAAMQTPELARLGEDNKSLADQRTGEDSLTSKIEAAGRELNQARESLAELRERFRTVRRRELAAGLTDAIGLILRRFYEELPSPGDLQRKLRLTQEQLADAELRSVLLEEDRADAGDIDRALQALLARLESGGTKTAELEPIARELLVQRRDLLDALITDTDRLLSRLVELDVAQRELATGSSELRSYAEKRILWIRSVQGHGVPSPRAGWDAASWLLTNPAWGRSLHTTWEHIASTPVETSSLAILLLLLLAGWLWARETARGFTTPPTFPQTLRKAFGAVATAAPPAFAVYAVGWLLARPAGQVQPALAVGAGLKHIGLVVFVLVCTWKLLRRRGLAADLHWTRQGAQHIRRHLAWFIPIKLVCDFVVVTIDRQPVSAWSDSVGRLAFCVGLAALTVFSQRLLRPGGPLLQSNLERNPTGWVARLRPLWYSVVLGLPVILGGLALGGYYYTAVRLQACFEASLVLVGGLLVLHGLLLRWLLLARRRLAQQQVTEAPTPAAPTPAAPTPADTPAALDAEAPATVETPVAPSTDVLEALDLAAIRTQSGQLFKSIVVVCLFVGLYMIWIDVLPALQRLDQVQIWPSLAIVDLPQEEQFAVLERAAPPAPAPAAPTTTEDAGATPQPTTSSLPGARLPVATTSPVDDALPARVTLADLGAALIVLFFTLVLSKNLPGVLEIVLLERLPLDAGARYAAITVTRYLVLILGITVGVGKLGVGWSNVQWLAAALTFGLAFGLQEIFANFISGLILLAEQPIRVGDVVTVGGGINGKVSKIRIRATTITQWNGKELVIPNKSFVTGEVVNWTLSEPQVRLEIPVGVAYGSNTALAKELLVHAARSHPVVLREPEPNAFFLGFGASSLDFELRVWLPSPASIMQVREDLLETTQAAFREVDIEIAFPQHDLHIRSGELAVRLQGNDAPSPPVARASKPVALAERVED